VKRLTTALAALLIAVAAASGQSELARQQLEQVRAYRSAEAVSPSDGADLPHVTKAIWVGTTGNIKVDMTGTQTTGTGGTVTFNSVPVGFFKVEAKRVYSTGTTATNMIAVF
jgi:hypothetical protein